MVEDEDDYSMPGDSPNSKINGSMPKSSTAIKVTPVEIAVPGRDAGQLSQDSTSVAAAAAAAKAVEVKPKGQSAEKKQNDNDDDDYEDDDDGYSDESFVEQTIESPKAKPEAPQQKMSILPTSLQVPQVNDSQSSYSMVTGITSQAPAMNPAFQPKAAQPSTLGTKPAILGSKPNFLAKKRKF